MMKKNKNGFVTQGIIAVVSLVLIIGSSYYLGTINTNESKNKPEVLEGGVVKDFKGDALINKEADISTSEYKTYTSKEYTLSYPGNWIINENLSEGVILQLTAPNGDGELVLGVFESQRSDISAKPFVCKDIPWTKNTFNNLWYRTECLTTLPQKYIELATANEEDSVVLEKMLSTFKLNSSTVNNDGIKTPVITSISPMSGPVGSVIELGGTNFAGFESDLNAWIVNEKGEKGIIFDTQINPKNYNLIKVKIEDKVCKKDTSYSGLPCPEYMKISPGKYNVYTAPWGKESNKVIFTVVD